ncbi:Kinesin-like protein kif27 [Rhizophlyctis rosea]|nr:Kinesin-like protein kif27 [Rhizophlyctis rosea]
MSGLLSDDQGKETIVPAQNGETWWETFLTFFWLPDKEPKETWDKFMVCVSLTNAVLITFMAAFQYSSVTAWFFTYLLDFLYVVDIYTRFHIAYLEGGFWVVFPKEMALRYIRSSEFIFDVTTNLPTDIFALIWRPSSHRRATMLAVFRLWKVLRTGRIIIYFRRQEQKVHAGFPIQVAKFVCFLAILTHSLACCWFAIACTGSIDWSLDMVGDNCRDDSWMVDKGFTSNPLNSVYVGSLYWAVISTTTTGYGDIHPQNDSERVFAMFTVTIGILFYNYVSGTIASTLSNMDSRRVTYQQKMDGIKQYMNDRRMDPKMQARVEEYYDYVWERNRGIDVRNVFGDMPSTFKSEVALSLNHKIIENTSIFKDTSLGFRRMMAIHMKLYLFTAKEYVVHKGDLGLEMFFITQGRVDIFQSPQEAKKPISLIDGSHFGEFGVILGHRHEYSARAECNTDIYVLTANEIAECFAAYPEDKSKVQASTEAKYKQQLALKRSRTAAVYDEDDDDDLGGAGGVEGGVILPPVQLGGSRNALDQIGEPILGGTPATPKSTNGGKGRRQSIITGYAILDKSMAALRSQHDIGARKSVGQNLGSKGSLKTEGSVHRRKSIQASSEQAPDLTGEGGNVPPVPPLPSGISGRKTPNGAAEADLGEIRLTVPHSPASGRVSRSQERVSTSKKDDNAPSRSASRSGDDVV